MSVTIDWKYYARLLRILGDDCIMLLPYWDNTVAAGGVVADISAMNYHFAMGAAAFDEDPALRGTTNAYHFNGVDEYLTRADTRDFTFTTAGNIDAPFSVGAWVNMEDMTDSVIMCKHTTAAPEWVLEFSATDDLTLTLFDLSVPASGGRDSAALTALENEWIFVCGTYSGIGGDGAGGLVEAAGIDLYVYDLAGALLIDTGNVGAGNYVDMENLTSPVYVGAGYAAALEDYFDGKMALPFATRHELSAAAVLRAFETGRHILSL